MTRRRLLHPETGSRRTSAAPLLDRAERYLLLFTACILVFALGVCLKHALAGSTPPVMATVTVRDGDTLWEIAARYGDPDQYILERVDALVKANDLKRGQVLQEGQALVVPVGNRSAKLYYGGKYASREIAD